MRNVGSVLGAGLCLGSLALPLMAQERDTRELRPGLGIDRRGGAFAAGTIRRLSEDEVQTLRSMLHGEQWPQALELYFGNSYMPELVDLVIYVDSAVTRQAIIKNDEIVEDLVLTGEKFIYVNVFVPCHSGGGRKRGGTPQDTISGWNPRPRGHATASVDRTVLPQAEQDSIQVSRSSLNYKVDPVLTALIKGFGQKLFGASPDPLANAVRDTLVYDKLDSIGTSGREALCLGFKKIALAENTTNRISVRAAPGWELPDDEAVLTNFGNASGSYFGVSIAGGATFNARTTEGQDAEEVQGQQTRVALYVFGHGYIDRPLLPWKFNSVSVVGGTNLYPGNVLDDIVVGLSADRLVLKTVGVIVGLNFLTAIETGTKTRKLRPYVGLDFQL